MLTTILAAGGAAAGAENPYGLGQALKEGCQDAYDNEMEARYGEGW
jgi:hypothetical protein